MPVLDFNISNKEQLLLASDSLKTIAVQQCNVCNTSISTITISFFKLNTGNESRFYLINAIQLTQKETFVLENVQLAINQQLYIGVSGGSCSTNLNYFNSN